MSENTSENTSENSSKNSSHDNKASEPVEVITIIPPDEPVHISKGDIMRATKWRRAIKKYNGEHITDEDWNFILEMGRLAPTSMGLEAWNMIDISNTELISKIADISWGIGEKFPGLDHLVVFTIKSDQRPESDYFCEIRKAEGYTDEQIAAKIVRDNEFQGPDYQNLVGDERRRDWGIRQAYIAATQMLVGASLIGVDSTPIEGFPIKAVTKVLVDAGVLDDTVDTVAYMTCFGFRAEDPHKKTRRPLNQVVRTVK
jgi:nitroreductase